PTAYCLQRFIDLSPIHHVPPRADVVGPAVLELQVVRVLPDVEAEERRLAFHERVVLVRGAGYRQLAAIVQQPHPPAAEAAGSGLAPLLFEGVEAAERPVDRVRDLAAGGA